MLPIVFVTMEGFMSLFMPAPISGARPALSVTVMLTTATVYLVASRMTPQSDSTSMMSRLYIVSFSMNLILVFLSILTTALISIQVCVGACARVRVCACVRVCVCACARA